MTPTRRAPAFCTALFTARTWREFAYALLGLPIGVIGFAYTVTTFAAGVGLAITFLGLPVLALTGAGARLLASGVRRLANTLLGTDVPAPPRVRRPEPGLLAELRAYVADPHAWRARLYLVLKLPMGIASFVMAVTFYAYGLAALSYWSWRPFLPCNGPSPDGRCHRAAELWNNHYIETPGPIALTAATGLVLLLLAPWVVRGVVAIDKALVRALLGPTESSLRVAELEQTRAVAVDDSAATLRRIERDLHDGAQARLVALAMNVGLAKEKLAEGSDPTEAHRLLETAHTSAKEAIVELRELARGIHPPVLDAGLDTALATLAAQSAVPVELRTAIVTRPAPALETIAYFCAAELLTNVAKHSGASSAVLDARTAANVLRLQVSDDGHGGARVGAGSGLAGLSERIGTVDGHLAVHSPEGGPTVVTVELPLTNRSG